MKGCLWQAVALSCHVVASAAWCQSKMLLDSWGAVFLGLRCTCTQGPLAASWTMISDALEAASRPYSLLSPEPVCCEGPTGCGHGGGRHCWAGEGPCAAGDQSRDPCPACANARDGHNASVPAWRLKGQEPCRERDTTNSQLRLRATLSMQGQQKTTSWHAVES